MTSRRRKHRFLPGERRNAGIDLDSPLGTTETSPNEGTIDKPTSQDGEPRFEIPAPASEVPGTKTTIRDRFDEYKFYVGIATIVITAVGIVWYAHSINDSVKTIGRGVENLLEKVGILAERSVRTQDAVNGIKDDVKRLDEDSRKTQDGINELRLDLLKKKK